MEPEPTDDIVIIDITPEELAEFPEELPKANTNYYSLEKKRKTKNAKIPPRIPSLLKLHMSPPQQQLVRSR